LHDSEYSILEEMLYNAIFIPPGTAKLPFGIIRDPEIYVYIKNFGKAGDYCLVADINDRIIGAIWTREFYDAEKGFGFVNTETPELSMSVLERYRNKGVGTKLLLSMIRLLTELDYKQVSLSVDRMNYAYDFYRKLGFEDYKCVEGSVTMLRKLNGKTSS